MSSEEIGMVQTAFQFIKSIIAQISGSVLGAYENLLALALAVNYIILVQQNYLAFFPDRQFIGEHLVIHAA